MALHLKPLPFCKIKSGLFTFHPSIEESHDTKHQIAMIETNIVWYESCGLSDVRRMDGTAAQITREEKILLNFDEVVALWYFALALWYGWLKHRNSKSPIQQSSNRDSDNSASQNDFAPIHWLILVVSIMGLANFLFSFSLLEVMNHKSSIGSSVLKLSYISKSAIVMACSSYTTLLYTLTNSIFRSSSDMIFSCLLHPCTLSLGVLAPKAAFGYDRYYYFPSESTARSESTKSTTICLAALVCAQLVLRLMENLMVLFCFGGSRKSETVKLADFFEYLLDGIFLAQMVQSLYRIIMDMSHERGLTLGFNRWQVWWKSRRLRFFLVLYGIFVAISTVLVLIGASAFFGASVLSNEHSVYTNYKVHSMIDLFLLTGIAILLRPRPSETAQRLEIGDIGGDVDPEIDYQLLRTGSNEEENRMQDADNDENDIETVFEMTAAASNSSDAHSLPLTNI